MTDFLTYKGLTADEELAIAVYLNCNDLHALDGLINQGDMTKDMRRFVANVVNGSMKRPPGAKPSTELRDIRIYNRITNLLLDDPNLNLTSNRSTDGAGAIVAKELGVSDDVAIKVFDKIKKELEEAFSDAIHGS